jgi:pyruvate/2-oxoglutarate dehydrogenase complex dihydrolipoamide acyltransferase (E2) component
MAVSVAVPRLGLSMAGGLVAEWYLADGAAVSEGDPVCRIECEYVSVDVEADTSGVLRHRRPAGSLQRPGDVLGVILASGERMPTEDDQDAPKAATPVAPPRTAEQGPARPADESAPQEATAPERIARTEPTQAPFPFPRRAADDTRQADSPVEPLTASGTIAGDFRNVAEQPAREADGGGPIADLPLWEPPDLSTVPVKDPSEPRTATPAELEPEDVPSNVTHLPFAGQPFEALRVLSMRVTIAMLEAAKLREQLAREWLTAALRPTNEDIVLRAVSRTIVEQDGADGTVELTTLEAGGALSVVIGRAGQVRFRDAVARRAHGGEYVEPECRLTSFAAHRIDEGTPDLAPGQHLAFAMGRERATAGGGPVLTLVLAYDRNRIDEASAAQLLARVRDLVEAPYALLAE